MPKCRFLGNCRMCVQDNRVILIPLDRYFMRLLFIVALYLHFICRILCKWTETAIFLAQNGHFTLTSAGSVFSSPVCDVASAVNCCPSQKTISYFARQAASISFYAMFVMQLVHRMLFNPLIDSSYLIEGGRERLELVVGLVECHDFNCWCACKKT